MTFKEKYLQDNPGSSVIIDDFVEHLCPDDCGYEPDLGDCPEEFRVPSGEPNCNDCWNREMPEENPIKQVIEGKITTNEARERFGLPPLGEPRILDSGNRREFESGAVRDCPEGKGRCDLLPLDVVGIYMNDSIFHELNMFVNSGDVNCLYRCLNTFNIYFDDGRTKSTEYEITTQRRCTMILEVAIHFEEGAKKYGDSNWQKGIPVRCYIDSAVRHYLKFLRGDKDEPHDRAFCWNILCAIWTCKHKPELNEYAKAEEKE